jgi:hypothetical protein
MREDYTEQFDISNDEYENAKKRYRIISYRKNQNVISRRSVE